MRSACAAVQGELQPHIPARRMALPAPFPLPAPTHHPTALLCSPHPQEQLTLQTRGKAPAPQAGICPWDYSLSTPEQNDTGTIQHQIKSRSSSPWSSLEFPALLRGPIEFPPFCSSSLLNCKNPCWDSLKNGHFAFFQGKIVLSFNWKKLTKKHLISLQVFDLFY